MVRSAMVRWGGWNRGSGAQRRKILSQRFKFPSFASHFVLDSCPIYQIRIRNSSRRNSANQSGPPRHVGRRFQDEYVAFAFQEATARRNRLDSPPPKPPCPLPICTASFQALAKAEDARSCAAARAPRPRERLRPQTIRAAADQPAEDAGPDRAYRRHGRSRYGPGLQSVWQGPLVEIPERNVPSSRRGNFRSRVAHDPGTLAGVGLIAFTESQGVRAEKRGAKLSTEMTDRWELIRSFDDEPGPSQHAEHPSSHHS
eukprot:scaffold304_cov248-Pinguiococcus_pyrenoidosus.AAC.11